jgi:hypothetical protein
MCKMEEFDSTVNYREAKGYKSIDGAGDKTVEEDLVKHYIKIKSFILNIKTIKLFII